MSSQIGPERQTQAEGRAAGGDARREGIYMRLGQAKESGVQGSGRHLAAAREWWTGENGRELPKRRMGPGRVEKKNAGQSDNQSYEATKWDLIGC